MLSPAMLFATIVDLACDKGRYRVCEMPRMVNSKH